MEELFIDIETIVGGAEDMEELRRIKMEYFKQHRLLVSYFNYVQEQIEQEDEVYG